MNKIIIFSALSVWSIGNNIGAPSFYKTILGYLDEGWDVTLVTPHSINPKHLKGLKVEKVDDIVAQSSSNKILHFANNVVFSKKIEKEFYLKGKSLIEKNKKEKPIIYAYEVHAVKACKRLAEKYNLHLVTRFQGTIMSEKKNSLINRIGYYPHYQALKEKSDLVVMTNDGTFGEQYLRKIGNNSKVLFLRNGVDVAVVDGGKGSVDIRENLGINKDDFVLMTVSRLVNWKRIDRAISILPKVVKKYKNVKLIIVGDGEEKEKLENLSNELNVQNWVVFAGGVSQESVPLYLDIADIFLSLYDIGNLGNPIFEAMKCGKAIVTLNNGDTASLMVDGDNCVLLDVGDLPSLADTIIDLIEDEEMRKYISCNARECAKKEFRTWEERMNYECKFVKELCEQ